MRGEGNHKIPGSFAPENMEKTGAERVKYSLACQHEDAISIKFVSYAQKCPTVLCTFAVALRKESVDRNYAANAVDQILPGVALRKESVDRNISCMTHMLRCCVSLSVRRAWIEILSALAVWPGLLASLSVRRAWIEIASALLVYLALIRSLSVRRAWIEMSMGLDGRFKL